MSGAGQNGGAHSATALRWEILAVLGVTLLAAIAMPLPGDQRKPFALTSDNATSEYPLLADAYRQTRAGGLPVWTSGRWGGSPLIGDPLVGALYPPYYAAFALTDFPHRRALDLAAAFHLLLLSSGTILLLRLLEVRWSVALALTVALACNPTAVIIAKTWAELWGALSYWPWLFAAAWRMSEKPRLGWGLLAAAALAAQVYVGYGQFALYSGCAALTWIAVRPGRARTRRVLAAVLAGAGGVGLAMPQVLPALDMAEGSIRLGPQSTQMMGTLGAIGLSVDGWLEVFRTSKLRLLPCKVAPFVGVLAVVGLGTLRPAALYFGAVIVIAGFLSTVPNPIYRALHALPPFSLFGAPVKFFYLGVFAFVVLAALGLDRSLAMTAAGRRIMLAVAVALATLSFADVFPGLSPLWIGTVLLIIALPTSWLNVAILTSTILGAAAFLVAVQPAKPLDIASMGRFSVLIEEKARTTMDALLTPERLVALWGRHQVRVVGTNYGALWGVETLNGIGPLVQWRQFQSVHQLDYSDLPQLLRQWAVSTVAVITPSSLERQLTDAGFRDVGTLGELRFLSSPQPASPRYVLVPDARAVTAENAIAAARRGAALTATSVLIEAASLPAGTSGDPNGRVEVIEDDLPRVALRVSVDRPTWLVARQPYYRNWRATADGESVEIHPAAGFFLAVLVQPGVQVVRLEYVEPGLWRGVLIAAFTAVALPYLFHRLSISASAQGAAGGAVPMPKNR